MIRDSQEQQFKPPPYIRLRLTDFLNRIRERDDFVIQAQQLLNLLGYKSSRKPLRQSGCPLEFLQRRADQIKLKSDKTFVNGAQTAKVIFQVTNGEIKTALKEKRINGVRWGETASATRSFMFCAVELKRDGFSSQELLEMMWSISRVYRGIPILVLFKHRDKLSIGLFDRRKNRFDTSENVLLPRSVKKFATHQPDHIQIAMWLKLSLNSCLGWMREKGGNYNFDGLLNAWQMALCTRKLIGYREEDLKDVGYLNRYLDMHIVRTPSDGREEWAKYLGATCCRDCENYY